MVILLVGKRDPVYGHAAVGRVSFGIARGDVACILPRASRPPRLGATKLSCKVAHASVVYPGGSIAQISGDKVVGAVGDSQTDTCNRGHITEEPCAAKVARTVLKQRWRERSLHRL